MKIKTRLAMAFLAVTVLPMALIYLAFWGLSHYQINSFKKAYGLSEQVRQEARQRARQEEP